MKPLLLVKISRALLLALLLPASMLVAQNPDSPAISSLLERVKTHAALADRDAATLVSFTRSNLHWSTHSAQLNNIKVNINNLIRDTNEMASLRPEGSPWQQQAIDRISPLLPEMAAHLTATIQHLKENLNRTQMQPYRQMVLTNQKLIHKAHEIIADFVDYGEAKAKVDALESELQLAASANPGM